MKITHTVIDERNLLKPHGRIDTLTSPELEGVLQPLLLQDKILITIDFKEVTYISSAGLRVLIKAAQKAKQGNTEVHLIHLNESVAQVLEITGFQSFFNIQ
ncbi:MAG TPA: STAS domain-containing protein [Chitinophagales bacterium]|nr:STAS domain-containing protein [Chitinophagales bacterium]